jgi:Protein of unknown function (DUF3102)
MALPEPVDPIETYLDKAASEIIGRGRQIVVDIIAIGRQLVEVKQRIGHGRYEAFVRDRLGFSVSSALRFVRAYQMLESAKLTDLRLLEMVQIDCSALYLLSSPATPEQVRAAALEAAASGQRVRHAEVKEKVALARRTVSMTEEQFKSTMAGMIGEAKRDLNSIAENLGLKASAGDGWDEDRAMTRVERVIVEELRCGGPTPPPYATRRFVDMLRLWADRLDRPVN